MNGELFPDFEAVGERWRRHWKIAAMAGEGLDEALGYFLFTELQDDGGAHSKSEVLFFTMTAVSRAGTHSEDTIKAAIERAMEPQKKEGVARRTLSRADTRFKRIALVAFPFFAVACIFRWYRDVNYSGDFPSALFVLLFMASGLCLLLALTKMGDWLNRVSE